MSKRITPFESANHQSRQTETQDRERLDWVAVVAAVATGVIFLVATAKGPNVFFTIGATVFWLAFVGLRIHRDRNALVNWGFRGDNLLEAAKLPAVLLVVATLAFAAYAVAKHQFRFPAHTLLLFLIYPLWGVIQQFLVLGVVVGNLEKVGALRRRPILLVLAGTVVFGAIHLPDPVLTAGTTALALVYVPLFLRHRNVWPLGVVHGWIASLFYLWVLGRDVWTENCCPKIIAMSLRLVTILVGLLLLGNAAHAAASCTRLKSQPDRWVTARVDALVLTARRAYEREQALAAYQTVLAHTANTIEQCRLEQDTVFAGRYRRFLEYIATVSLDLQPDHELGFTVPDELYFAETRQYVQIPEFLLDQRFLRLVSRYETLDQARDFLRTLNSTRETGDQLIFFSYISQHLGTPDNDDSFRRLLIVVPGNPAEGVPEKWVQFGVTDPGARVRVRNVSVVATMPASDGTSNVYFKDFFRTYRRDGVIRIKGRWELGHGDDNCVQCHKSGVLPIFPEKDSVAGDEREKVLAVNRRLLTYGPARFGKYLDGSKLGPGLGTATAQDRGQRFGVAFASSIVGRAMVCAACHHQERLGALNWPMDKVLISSFIKGGEMPLGHKLRPAERSALHEKLIQEYFAIDADHPGILKSWLLSRSQ